MAAYDSAKACPTFNSFDRKESRFHGAGVAAPPVTVKELPAANRRRTGYDLEKPGPCGNDSVTFRGLGRHCYRIVTEPPSGCNPPLSGWAHDLDFHALVVASGPGLGGFRSRGSPAERSAFDS